MQAQSAKRPRGRPRNEAGRQAILQTTSRLIYEIGLVNLSMEEIAKQSGVGKATLYRWWPSKTMVALDAYLDEMKGKVIVPDTGSAVEDIRQQIRAVISFYNGKEGRIFAEFTAAAQSDPVFATAFRERFLAERWKSVHQIWDRGVARREFRSDVDPQLALDLMYSVIVYRLLTGWANLSPSLADDIVRVAMTGLSVPAPGAG